MTIFRSVNTVFAVDRRTVTHVSRSPFRKVSTIFEGRTNKDYVIIEHSA